MSSQPPENPEQSSALIRASSTAVVLRQAESGLALVRDVLREGDATHWLETGKTAFDRKEYEYALFCLTRSVLLRPTYALAYAWKSWVMSRQATYREALEQAEYALTLDSNLAMGYFVRGNAKNALGDKTGAIADFDRTIELDPKDAAAYNNRGNVKSALGDKTGAIADYDRAIELDPKYAVAYNNRGYVKSELGDETGAIADYDRAIELDPKDALAYRNRGNAKNALGDKTGAEADFTKAAELERQAKQQAS